MILRKDGKDFSIWFLSFIHVFSSINKTMAFIWRLCDPMNFKFPVSCFHFIILKMSLVSSLKCFYCSFSPDVVDCHQLCFKAIPQQPFMPCCIHHVSSSFSVNCQKHWKLNCQDLRWMKRALTGRNDVSHMKKKNPFTVSGKSWGYMSQHKNVVQWE